MNASRIMLYLGFVLVVSAIFGGAAQAQIPQPIKSHIPPARSPVTAATTQASLTKAVKTSKPVAASASAASKQLITRKVSSLALGGSGSNIVCVGDSITVGTGASVQPPLMPADPLGFTNMQQDSSTYWISLLRQMSFLQSGQTIWNMGQGSQRIGDAVQQYTHSNGVIVEATLTNGSPTATITSLVQNGFVQSGEVVRTPSGAIPSFTTANIATVSTACSITDSGSGTNTISVTGSAEGLVNGMIVVSSSNNFVAGNGSIVVPDATTITISGKTIRTSAPISIYQSQTQPGNTVAQTLYFISPTVTLSTPYTGDSGSAQLVFGDTLITSTGKFRTGSASVTDVTTTGTSVGLVSKMGIGSKATAPGTTFSISGSTLTLSQPATASGTFTFFASAPTYNFYSPQYTYWEQNNSTPHLLSPVVTGVPGVFLNFYGVNDAGNQTDLASYENNYLALNALARADGYTVIDITQVPLNSVANFNYGAGTSEQDTMTAWTRQQAYPIAANGWDYLIDVAAIFPPDHPVTDIYHADDGIHPNDLGHSIIADLINTQLLADVGPGASHTSYGTWMTEFPQPADMAPYDTPQNDGVCNLLKYVFDLDPTQPVDAAGRAAMPAVNIDTTSTPGSEYLALTFRQNAQLTGLNVSLQYSSDLDNWTTASTPDLYKQVGTDPATRDPIIEIGVLNTPGTMQRFVRLNVSASTP